MFGRSLVVVFALVAAMPVQARAEPCLRLGAFDDPYINPFVTVIQEIYNAIESCVDFVRAPSQQLARMIREGELDGEVGRTQAYFADAPDVARVPTPLGKVQGLFVSRRERTVDVRRPDNLTGRLVATIRGSYWAEALAKRHRFDLKEVSSTEQLLKMLQDDRVEGFLLDSYSYRIATLSNRIDPNRFWTSPPLIDLSFYHYLNTRHRELVPALDAKIASLQNSGELDRIIEWEIIRTVEPVVRFDFSGSGAWFPFLYRDASGTTRGILAELIPEILARARLKGRPIRLPEVAGEEAFRRGEIDLDVSSLAWLPEAEPDPRFFQSHVLFNVEDVVVFGPGGPPPDMVGGALSGRSVGTVLGYDYRDADSFVRIDFENEQEVMRALADGRVTMAIVAEPTARYWAKQLGVEIAIGPVHTKAPIVLRMHRHMEPYADRLNAAIASLRADGTMERVLEAYR